MRIILIFLPVHTQVTVPLLSLLHRYMPNISPEETVCMDWDVEGTAAELPLLWVTAICLSYVWDRRKLGKPVLIRECRAELIGQWNLAKESKYVNESRVFEDIKQHI